MLESIIKIAKDAGKVLMSYYATRSINVMSKDKKLDVVSVLTKADLDSEELIISSLKSLFPKHNIYGEETGLINNHSEYTWYIDPLDGTSNFVSNIPIFGISIALVKKTNPILGLLYFPALDELVYAQKDKGAFFNSKKTFVSDKPLSKSLYHSGGFYNNKLALNFDIGVKSAFTKILGSSSYALAQIAKGDAEIYELTSVNHDVAAGVIIIREAGGMVTDYSGKYWTSNSKTILATNGVVHNDVLKILGA